MHNIIHKILRYSFSHGTAAQLGLFLLLFIAGWTIESFLSPSYHIKKYKHAFFNVLFLIVDALPQVLLGLLFIKIMHWTLLFHFGLIYLLPLSNHPVLSFIIVFISLDFGEYIYHVIMHKVKWLWRFHAVHHSDNIVDVSTVFREHPMESIIRNCFALLWVFLSGAYFLVFFIHLIMQTFFVIFSHTHIRLPKVLDKIVGFIFITPNIHQVHHHYKQPFTDRNYGDILSVWDRIFGTFSMLPYDKIIFGVDYLMWKKENTGFTNLLLLPFKRIKRTLPLIPHHPKREATVS